MTRKPDFAPNPAPATSARAVGTAYEALAAAWIERQGVRLLARNAASRRGEIDLIGLHHGTLVFFEVRHRRRSDYGGAAASVTAAKQRRILAAARYWLNGPAGRHHMDRPCRFDVLAFDGEAQVPQWIQGAFDLGVTW